MHHPGPTTPQCSRRGALARVGQAALATVLPWTALQGCSSPPVKVGFLGGLTGPTADLGIAGRDSTLLAVEQLNQRGGLRGKPVELVPFDDKQQPKALPALTDSIRQAGLAGMVGPMTSSVAAAWIPIANELALTTVSPTVTSSDFTGLDDQFFRVCSTTREYAYISAEYHMRSGPARRFALIRDNTNAAYTGSWAKHFSDRVQALGGQVAQPVEYTSGKQAEALTDALAQALAHKADALVIVANARDTALLAQFARSPGFAEVAAFDAATVMLRALAEQASGESLKQVLLRIKRFEGLQQPVVFDAAGDAPRPLFVTRVVNGQFTVAP